MSIKMTEFNPKINGFHFSNSFASLPIHTSIGNINLDFKGRCGGMVYAALDYFYSKTDIPETKEIPHAESWLDWFIAERQLKSGSDVADKTVEIQFTNWFGSRTREFWGWGFGPYFDAVKAYVDAKTPIPLVLHTASGSPDQIQDNHQVLAIGYEDRRSGGDFVIKVYDPNCPDIIRNLVPDQKIAHFRLSNEDGSRSKDYLTFSVNNKYERAHVAKWNKLNLTAASSAASGCQVAPAKSNPSAYILGDTQHVTYRDGGGNIQELWWSNRTKNWKLGGAIAAANQYGSAVENPFAYTQGNTQTVLFQNIPDSDSDGPASIKAIHSSALSGWRWNVVHVASSPVPSGDPVSCVLNGVPYVAYKDRGQALNIVAYVNNAWCRIGPDASVGLPGANGDPSLYACNGWLFLCYNDVEGRVRLVGRSPDGQWTQRDISSAVGITDTAVGQPISYAISNDHFIAFRDSKGGMHMLNSRNGLDWIHSKINEGASAKGDPKAFVRNYNHYIVYTNVDDHIECSFWSPAAGWQNNVISELAKSTQAIGDPCAYVIGDIPFVVYRDVNDNLITLWFQ